MRKFLTFLTLLLLGAVGASAQGIYYTNNLLSNQGTPLVGANVAVCTPSSNVTVFPCTPLASIYSNEALTTSATNPFSTDANGTYSFWAAPGHYIIQIYGANLPNTTVDVFLPCDPSLTAGSPGACASNITVPVTIANGGTGATTASGARTALGTPAAPATSNGQPAAIEPLASDAVQFVSASGNDSNDGLSWGSAKATVAAAIAALPGCTSGSSSWPNCGVVRVGAGAITVASQVTIASPFVKIIGSGEKSTQIDYTGSTGCALDFAPATFNGGQNSSQSESMAGGVYDLVIDGTSAGAGTCGIETYNSSGFHAAGVGIQNFSGVGDAGWYETTSTSAVPSERRNVEMDITNCTTGWEMLSPSPGGGTFGYGFYNVFINPTGSQTAILSNGAAVTEALLHIVVNGPGSTGTGLELENGSTWNSDSGLIHIEGVATGITTDATSDFVVGATVDVSSTTTPYSFNASSYTAFITNSSAQSHGLGIQPISPAFTFHIGSTADTGGTNGALAIGMPSGSSIPPLWIGQGGNFLFELANDGSVYDSNSGATEHYTFPNASGTLGLIISSTTGSLAWSALSANSCANQTVTVTGATTSMLAEADPSGSLSTGGNLDWSSRISASNTVEIKVCNVSTGSVTPNSVTWNVRVIQ